jgi:hypothetical protein
MMAGIHQVLSSQPELQLFEGGYTLERSTDGVNWQPITELSANTLRYGDYGLARRTAY